MPGALTGLKWLGAAYLLVLAWQSWTAARAEPANGAAFGMTPRTALRCAFVINAANPKVALVMLAVLPQFTQPALGPIWPQIVFLGLIVTVTGGSVTSAYGFLAGFLGATLARRVSVLNRLAAGMLVILALSFAFQ